MSGFRILRCDELRLFPHAKNGNLGFRRRVRAILGELQGRFRSFVLREDRVAADNTYRKKA